MFLIPPINHHAGHPVIRGRSLLWGCLMLLVYSLPSIQAAENSLTWDRNGERITADVSGWTIEKTLEEMAARTGWEIYMEPDSEHTVWTRFRNLPVGEALGRIAGKLNYALIPRPGQPDQLFVFSTRKDKATKKIIAKKSNKLDDELILTLEDGMDPDEIARKLNGKIIGKIDGLNVFRMKFDDPASVDIALDQLSQLDGVESDFNYYIEAPPTPLPSPNTTAFPLNLDPTPVSREDAIVIGLIDTAIQLEGSPYAEFVLDTLNLGQSATTSSIAPTHGTHVLDALLTGIAASGEGSTKVRIVAVDVYGNNLSTTTYDATAGGVKAVENGATVLNFSLGGPDDTTYFRDFIDNVTDKGVVVVASAGNNGSTTTIYPAAFEKTISVTALGADGQLTSYANQSPTVDAAAPGINYAEFNHRTYVSEGTSVASPQVAGAIAHGIEAGLTPAQATQTVVESSPVPK